MLSCRSTLFSQNMNVRVCSFSFPNFERMNIPFVRFTPSFWILIPMSHLSSPAENKNLPKRTPQGDTWSTSYDSWWKMKMITSAQNHRVVCIGPCTDDVDVSQPDRCAYDVDVSQNIGTYTFMRITTVDQTRGCQDDLQFDRSIFSGTKHLAGAAQRESYEKWFQSSQFFCRPFPAQSCPTNKENTDHIFLWKLRNKKCQQQTQHRKHWQLES